MFQKKTFKLIPIGNAARKDQPDYNSLGFAAPLEPKDGKIKMLVEPYSCRDSFIGKLRPLVMQGMMPTDKMRMIFYHGISTSVPDIKALEKEFDEWALRALKVLQTLDKRAGWPATVVYKLETDKPWKVAYYFRGSRRWIKSSYLLSLYALLIRMCADERIDGFKTFAALIDLMQSLRKSSPVLQRDHEYVMTSMPYWEAILAGYPELFRKRKITYYWSPERLTEKNMAAYEGIQSLVTGNTKYSGLTDKLKKIQKELDQQKRSK